MTPEFKENYIFQDGVRDDDSQLFESSLVISNDRNKLRELLREELEKNIKNGVADKISQEVVLRNVIGPDYLGLNQDNKKELIVLVSEVYREIKDYKDKKKRDIFYKSLSKEAGKGILRDGKRMGMPSGEDEKETIKIWENGMNYGFNDDEK